MREKVEGVDYKYFIEPNIPPYKLEKEFVEEIRKTMPKCDLPIDVYIYCTKSDIKGARENLTFEQLQLLGKVVAKFTLNKVEEITNRYCKGMLIDSCLTNYELNNYLGNCIGYAWHISNLVIFDKPKELSEFQHKVKVVDYYKPFDSWVSLTKAPQSYMFIEVEVLE